MASSSTFDPRTAYAGNWQFLDRIEDAVLSPRNSEKQENADLAQDVKAREQDIRSTPFNGSYNFRGRVTVFEVWAVDGELREPQSGDSLLFQTKRWSVHDVTKRIHGPSYLCLCSSVGMTGADDEL